jgi:hypothetical protein
MGATDGATERADEFEFDVGLSFAGEDRWYVKPIAERLRAAGIDVFYDDFKQAEQWGEDLYVFFDDIFRKKARFAVAFISRDYVEKVWPRHEAKSAQARALMQDTPYLLPVRLDNSELPGLRPTVGYIDARLVGQDRLFEILLEKLAVEVPIERVPRTTEEIARVIATKPDGWEFLLFGGVLLERMSALDDKWRDHQIGYGAGGQILNEEQAREMIGAVLGEATAIVSNIERLFSPASRDQAFGALGEPGDPGRITHLAGRMIDVYGELLNWSWRLRSATVPDQYRSLFQTAARLATLPLEQFRGFVDRAVADFDHLVFDLRRIAADPGAQPPTLRLELTIEIDPAVMEEFNGDLAELRRHYGLD